MYSRALAERLNQHVGVYTYNVAPPSAFGFNLVYTPQQKCVLFLM